MKKAFALLILGVWLCGISSAAAQEKAEAGKEPQKEQQEESPMHTVARWANFIVLFGGLAFLLRKPMAEFFTARRNDIGEGLRRAEDAQTSAQARMDEIEKRLANLAGEVDKLRADAERESLAEREKVLQEAKHEVERIVEQSRQEIERVARTVEREIKEHVADQVIDKAGTALRTEMTQDDQKRIIVRFIQNL